MSKKTCFGCRFYQSITPEEDKEALKEGVGGVHRVGKCRASAPTAIVIPRYAFTRGDDVAVLWPVVKHNDWCGSYKPKEKKRG